MRGKRSSGCWGVASEFDNWVDDRCIAYLGWRAGRVEDMTLNSLRIWSAGVQRGERLEACLRDCADCDIRALGTVDRARDRRRRRQSILG